MKFLLGNLTIFLFITFSSKAQTSPPATNNPAPATVCNRFLLDSYDIDSVATPSTDTNFICPAATVNCCNYQAQVQIYKKFIVANEKSKIKTFYDEFPTAYAKIFANFKKIEEIASTTIKRTLDYPGSNCSKIAKKIVEARASKFADPMDKAVRRTYAFLLKAREGFYCSLCDGSNHRYFDLASSRIYGSYAFCAKMVQESLAYFMFKYGYFMKYARLYVEFLTKCDLNGKFFRSKAVRKDIRFFRKDEILGELESCFKGYSKPGAIVNCKRYCQRFNPVHYSEYLEGEVDKIFAYSKSLEKMMKKLQAKYKRDLQKENEAAKNGRLLQEEKIPKKTERLKEDVDQLTEFNREFKTAMVRPISYNFDEDMVIKFNTNFDESLFAPGVESIYNLVDFKTKLYKNGLNFFTSGEMSLIEKDAAMKAFSKLNPSNAATAEEFDKLISG